jgi:beta-galactosidase
VNPEETAPVPIFGLAKDTTLHVNEEAPLPGPAEAQALAGAGRFIVSFSYSGPTSIVHVEQNAADGKNVFVDRDLPFANLPADLAGADWVQGANADSLYTAVDLMQIAVKSGSVVMVAHQADVPVPAWLEQKFRLTDRTLTLNGQVMKIYAHEAKSDESLTLGSNTDDPAVKKATAYIVFVQGAPGSQDSAMRQASRGNQ